MEPIRHSDILGDYYEHESFGIMCFNRAQGGAQPLFGSSILHRNVVTLEISHAELCRSDLHYDSYFATKRIIEVEMSPTQFSDAITGLNAGSGVPVTIRWLPPKGYLEPPPFESKVQQFSKEFDEVAQKVSQECDEVIARAMAKNLPKSFIKELDLLRGRIKSHFPFLNKQFIEQMDNTVKEAKGEVDAFINKTIIGYGIEAIKNQAPQLREPGDLIQLKEGKRAESQDKPV